MTLNLGIIDISKIKVDYRSSTMASKVDLGQLLVDIDKIDLKNQKKFPLTVSNLTILRAGLSLAKPQTVKKEVAKAIEETGYHCGIAAKSKGLGSNLRQDHF